MISGRAAAAAALAAGVAITAEAAAAQEQGPAERRVNYGVSASAVYDSAAGSGNGPALPGQTLREPTTRYNVNANIDALVPFSRFTTFASGAIGYQVPTKEERGGLRGNLAAGVGGEFAACNATLAGNYTRSQTAAEDLTRGVTQNVQESRGVTTSVSCAPVAGFTGAASYSYGTSENTGGPIVNNPTNQSVGVAFGYGNRALGTVEATASYSKISYGHNDPSPLQPLSMSSESYNVGVRYTRPIGRKLLGAIGVGWVQVKSASGLSDTDALSADVGLNYSPTQRLQLGLSYRRNASSTIIEGIDYTFGDVVDLNASYALSQRVRTTLGAGYTRRNFKGQVDPRLLGAPTEDEVWSVRSGVSMTVGRLATISLDAQYQDRSADVQDLSFDSVRVGVTTSVLF